jgi:hypothetical protein
MKFMLLSRNSLKRAIYIRKILQKSLLALVRIFFLKSSVRRRIINVCVHPSLIYIFGVGLFP